MNHLYFVRHGLSVMNVQGIWSGQTNTPLTDKGVRQCHLAGQQLTDANIDCIVTSPQKRARHTAEIIAAEIGLPTDRIIVLDELQERNFGPLEGTIFQSNADLDNTDGVEHSQELISRVALGVEYLRSLDADTILVVSHGAVGRAMRVLLQPGTSFAGSKKFKNAEVVKLV